MIRAQLVRDAFRAMGTDCEVAVTASVSDRARARRALGAARSEIESCEQALSRFRPESHLSRLNCAGGEWLVVDRRLIEALRTALRVRAETRGRFDPTVLPALTAAGYDRSFEKLDARPPSAIMNWHPGAIVEIDAPSLRARVELGAAVDLGGVGKGFAATQALWAMRDAWPELPGGLVDLGGDIAVWGAAPGWGPWRLSIADPRVPGSSLATIAIYDGAVATSGRDQRRFGPELTLHHLIDPDIGTPADTGPLAVTVIGVDAAEVDAYATALAITHPDEAPVVLEARPSLAGLLVPPEGDPIVFGEPPLLERAAAVVGAVL